MNIRKVISKNIKNFISVLVFFAVFLSAMPAKAQVILTKEEQDYINKGTPIKAVSVQGGAPLQYTDANGQIRGISKEVLDKISDMTGLVFTYQLYDTIEEVLTSGADIVFGIPYNYAPESMVMSIPFLETETILYINSSVNPNELEEKKFASTKGSSLPEGIKEENTIYFETREESIKAVNSGRADYGYGNAYSVAFYIIQNSYRNIIAIPDKKESREYCIGFLKNDEILLSIINKSISSIDETYMRTLILNATTQIDRKITTEMILDAYGPHIFGAIFLLIAILLLSIVWNIRAKNELKIQNERYQILSQTSNEYVYEYHVKTKHLELSKNCIELFGDVDIFSELKGVFENVLMNTENTVPIIELPTAMGNKCFFKSVNSLIYDDKNRVYFIIGKLIDISKEEAEKQELIKKSETDGLTGIYNAATTKNLINESLKNADTNLKNALILIDCDKFKAINDAFGHLQGDMVLVSICKSLTRVFRKTDIIGRIGGDEFCVYMRGAPSSDFVESKCRQVMDYIQALNKEYPVTVSIGISFLENEKSYDELFYKADAALYEAKEKGRGRICFSHGD